MPNIDLPTQVTTLILAGGQGRRMRSATDDAQCNALPKALQILSGKPLIEHVVEQLRDCSDTTLISCNRHEANYFEPLGLPLLFDPDDLAFCGPLTGIRELAVRCETDFAFICPCDTPFVSSELVYQLVKQLIDHPDADACYAKVSGQAHYLPIAIRQKALATSLDPAHRETRAVKRWLKTLNCVELSSNIAEKSVLNINSPSDMAKAEVFFRQNEE